MPLLTPMPSASVTTAVSVNPGVRRNVRSAKRVSCTKSSSHPHPQASRSP